MRSSKSDRDPEDLAKLFSAQRCTKKRAIEADPPPFDTSTAAAAFRVYVGAVRGRDWGTLARVMHPDALARMHTVASHVEKADDDETETLRILMKVHTPGGIARLSQQDVFERLIGLTTAVRPEWVDALRMTEPALIGRLEEGDVVHLVYRLRLEGEPGASSIVDLVSLRRSGEEWRVLLNEEMVQTLWSLMAYRP